jgi:hypothetical protein
MQHWGLKCQQNGIFCDISWEECDMIGDTPKRLSVKMILQWLYSIMSNNSTSAAVWMSLIQYTQSQYWFYDTKWIQRRRWFVIKSTTVGIIFLTDMYPTGCQGSGYPEVLRSEWIIIIGNILNKRQAYRHIKHIIIKWNRSNTGNKIRQSLWQEMTASINKKLPDHIITQEKGQ